MKNFIVTILSIILFIACAKTEELKLCTQGNADCSQTNTQEEKKPNVQVTEFVCETATVSVQTEPVDILFVIDNSGSMAEEQTKLRAAMQEFIQLLTLTEVSYQIGVTITDLRLIESDTFGGSCDSYYHDFEGGCLRGLSEGLIIYSKDAYETQLELFKYLTSVGTCGSTWEQGLEAARRVIQYTDTSSCPSSFQNRENTFIRKDANLLIIVLSDEDDCSHSSATKETLQLASDPGPEGAYQQCYHSDNLIPVDDYIDFFKKAKGIGNEDKVKFAAIIGSDSSGNASGCFFDTTKNQASTECSEDAIFQGCAKNEPSCNKCLAAAGTRYAQVAEGLGKKNTLIESICNPSYTLNLLRIATNLIIPNSLKISAQLDPSKEVRVKKEIRGDNDHTEIIDVPKCAEQSSQCINGQFYDANSNEIYFFGDYALKPNEIITYCQSK